MNEPDKLTTPEPEEEKKDLLDALLDLSFRTAITPKVIRWLYIIGLVASALFAARWALTAFSTNGIFSGIVSLALAPIVFALYALVTRVFLEITVAIFRIADALTKNGGKLP